MLRIHVSLANFKIQERVHGNEKIRLQIKFDEELPLEIVDQTFCFLDDPFNSDQRLAEEHQFSQNVEANSNPNWPAHFNQIYENAVGPNSNQIVFVPQVNLKSWVLENSDSFILRF